MTESDDFRQRAHALLEASPLIDGHNDLAIALRSRVGGIGVSSVDLRGHVDGLETDIHRLRSGRVGGQFWSVWVPAELAEERALPMALEQLDIADGFADRYPDVFGRATTADEVEAAFAGGRIASGQSPTPRASAASAGASCGADRTSPRLPWGGGLPPR